jgi:hypothetical protein
LSHAVGALVVRLDLRDVLIDHLQLALGLHHGVVLVSVPEA